MSLNTDATGRFWLENQNTHCVGLTPVNRLKHSWHQSIKLVYHIFKALGMQTHPNKTFLGKANKRFDSLGFANRPTGLTVSGTALSRRDTKLAQLYEQGASKKRIGLFLARWLGWGAGMLATSTVTATATLCPGATIGTLSGNPVAFSACSPNGGTYLIDVFFANNTLMLYSHQCGSLSPDLCTSAVDANTALADIGTNKLIDVGASYTGDCASENYDSASPMLSAPPNSVYCGQSSGNGDNTLYIRVQWDGTNLSFIDNKGPWYDTDTTTTMVEIASLHMRTSDSGNVIRWQTATELDNAGFDVQRERPDGTWVTLNKTLIKAKGDASEYEFVDTTAQHGITYRYRLEDIDLSGVRSYHIVETITITATAPFSFSSQPTKSKSPQLRPHASCGTATTAIITDFNTHGTRALSSAYPPTVGIPQPNSHVRSRCGMRSPKNIRAKLSTGGCKVAMTTRILMPPKCVA
jgi:hypothetical protein